MNYERAVLSTIRKELSRLTPVIHALIGLAGRWVKPPLPKKFSNPLAFQLPTQPMTAPYFLIPRGVKDTVLNACPASGCRRINLFRLPEQPSLHAARNHQGLPGDVPRKGIGGQIHHRVGNVVRPRNLGRC
jgi:hypothetical protein